MITNINEIEQLFSKLLEDFSECKTSKKLLSVFKENNIDASHLFDFKNRNYFTNQNYLTKYFPNEKSDDVEKYFCILLTYLNFNIIESNLIAKNDNIKNHIIFYFKSKNLEIPKSLDLNLYLGATGISSKNLDEEKFKTLFEVVQKEKTITAWEKCK